MSRVDGFNRVARWYDWLKHLVFGTSISDSEVHFLHALPSSGDILVLGGGTGRFLGPLLAVRPDIRVCFVDASSVMLKLAQNHLPERYTDQVVFVHGTENDIPQGKGFDAVITYFFLDLFTGEQLTEVCRKLNASLKENGIWLVSDFVDNGKAFQRLLLFAMYTFFRSVAGVRAARLPKWQEQLPEKLQRIDCTTFCNEFILAGVYRKVADGAG